MGVAINVENLSRSFRKGGEEIRVLKDANLSLGAGESIALVGQSGSGKSTFLHLLGALEPPTSGEIRVDGVPLRSLDARALNAYRNRTVGFVFQFHHLLPDHDAVGNVAMPAMISGVPPAEARDRARERLEAVGLGHRLSHRPGELSGGEQQRVAIARALSMEPGLLLCDEPTGNLDPTTAAEILDLLLGLNQRRKATLVFVTHSLDLASRLPRRARLKDGGFVEETS